MPDLTIETYHQARERAPRDPQLAGLLSQLDHLNLLVAIAQQDLEETQTRYQRAEGAVALHMAALHPRQAFDALKRVSIFGNAYHDQTLLSALPLVAVEACSANDPTTAFEVLDYISRHVMGCAPQVWEGDREGFAASMKDVVAYVCHS